MSPGDLRKLDALLARAKAVVPMRDVFDGEDDPDVIGMRHDVDDRGFPTCLWMARWEHHHGYRSTYYMLHTAPYWRDPKLPRVLEEMASYGHEIGIHTNALAEALRTGADPHTLLAEAIERLRSWGHDVRGVVGHGDADCYRADRSLEFVNDEQFVECARANMGAPDRTLHLRNRSLDLQPRALADFGLEYESVRLPKALYLSDSGGNWKPGFDEVADAFPAAGQLHMLIHPDWWHVPFLPYS